MRNIIKIITIAVTATLFLTACTTNVPESATSSKKASKPNLKEASEINVKLAVGYIQQKQYQPAREKLEKSIEQDPENVVAYKTLAYLYGTLGMVDEADKQYNQATDLKPDDPDLANNYGAFLCSINKLDEAQEKFRVAYSNPFYKSIYLAESNAGSCYLKAGDYVKAEKFLRSSLRVQPKLPGSLISMAEVGVKTERYLMARAYIQRYHAESSATASSLWLQIQAEKALGAKDHYIRYARQLINEFPDSDEAGWVEAEARNEQIR